MIVDWGAGPGGWDVGATTLGLRPVGLEWGEAECATRAAAGHLTIRCDASAYPAEHLRGRLEGAILSTPCPDFSAAGKRAGLAGETGPLVYEVLRWADEARPRWIAAENVEGVAPIFRSFRRPLADLGYSVWTGVLDVADWGVPQNRRRAFLMASLDRPMAPPEPTHSRTGHDDLFGTGRLRWVSMAEALGWANDGRIVETQNGSAAPSGNYFDPFAKPSRTICGARISRWMYPDADGTPAGARRYHETTVDRPAPTVVPNDGRSNWKLRHPGRSYTAEPMRRPTDQPAPAGALGRNAAEWCWERPATTIPGSFANGRGGRGMVAPPGHHTTGTYTEEKGAIPVELWELGVLQGFPPDYPWRGSKSEQARQIGNAVPPPMAAHLLSVVTGTTLDGRTWHQFPGAVA